MFVIKHNQTYSVFGGDDFVIGGQRKYFQHWAFSTPGELIERYKKDILHKQIDWKVRKDIQHKLIHWKVCTKNVFNANKLTYSLDRYSLLDIFDFKDICI